MMLMVWCNGIRWCNAINFEWFEQECATPETTSERLAQAINGQPWTRGTKIGPKEVTLTILSRKQYAWYDWKSSFRVPKEELSSKWTTLLKDLIKGSIICSGSRIGDKNIPRCKAAEEKRKSCFWVWGLTPSYGRNHHRYRVTITIYFWNVEGNGCWRRKFCRRYMNTSACTWNRT
jgi:hypothetical protein